MIVNLQPLDDRRFERTDQSVFCGYDNKVELQKLCKTCEKLGITLLYDEGNCIMQMISKDGIHSETCAGFQAEARAIILTLEFMTQISRFGQMAELEQRVAALERVASQHCDAVADDSDAPQEAGNGLEELCVRAKAIGTSVQEQNGKIIYRRNRYKIPGTHYKFYFTVDNAWDQKRRQFRAKYTFTLDELDELERWIAHDEEIFAKCNETYGVPMG